MKSLPDYTSSLAGQMADFIAFKRIQGYNYCHQVYQLKQFDSFLTEQGYDEDILQFEVMQSYCAQTVKRENNYRAKRYSILRQFSLYLHAVDTRSTVLPKYMVPRQSRKTRYYPLNPSQIKDLMDAAGILYSENAIRSACLRFLIGLLYSTGLRIGEALALNLRDVDTKNSTIFVRHGKFGKERLLPMSDSTRDEVKKYLTHRLPYAQTDPGAPLLVAEWHKRLNYNQALFSFKRLCKYCGLEGDLPPRLHDLRHNYACRCIALWREKGEDVNALLPVLANAMGHVDFHATQVYIHSDAASLRQASAQFNQHINYIQENS